MNSALALKLEFDDDAMWVHLAGGRILGVPLAYFPRLLNAQPAQRQDYAISGAGRGLHWDALEEDVSVEHLLLGYGDRTVAPVAVPGTDAVQP